MNNDFKLNQIKSVRFGICVGVGIWILTSLMSQDIKIGFFFGVMFCVITIISGSLQHYNKKNNLK